MSITISLSFADAAAAVEFLGLVNELSKPLPDSPTTDAKTTLAKKSGKTEPLTPTPPTAVKEVKTPEPIVQEAAPQVLEYAPLAARITKLIGATNPKREENRQAIKNFFSECAESYGTPVKSGQDVRAADRPLLASLLTSLENGDS